MRSCVGGFAVSAIAALWLGAVSGGPALAAEDVCANETGDVAIAACTRDIESGRYKGASLAIRYNNRGSEWSNKHDYDSAIADFNVAVRLDPQYADAYYNRCLAYNRKENYDLAFADCDKAVSLGPTPNALNATGSEHLTDARTLSDYYTQRGIALNGQRQYDRAVAEFNEALRLFPQNPTAMRNRGRAYDAKGDTARANADRAAAESMR